MTEWVTRGQWGAPAAVNCTSIASTEGVAIHWLGPGAWAGNSPEQMMRTVRKWHLDNAKENYCDIAYNLGTAPGKILEGRSSKAKPRVRTGANGSLAVNSRFYAVLILLGAGDAPASEEHLRTAGEAVRWLRDNAGAGDKVVGHRDLNQTSCPGDHIYAHLEKIRAYAAGSTPPPPVPAKPVVYLSKLRFGQRDSDSVRELQKSLVRHNAPSLPVTGNYLEQTDAAVRKCQQAHGFGFDPPRASYVGPKQATHLMPNATIRP